MEKATFRAGRNSTKFGGTASRSSRRFFLGYLHLHGLSWPDKKGHADDSPCSPPITGLIEGTISSLFGRGSRGFSLLGLNVRVPMIH